MIKIKKIIIDFVLNIAASTIPLILLQYFILPYIAKKIGTNNYGTIILILGIINIIVSAFGNSLNNGRLVDNKIYEKIKGDYSIILIIFSISTIISSVLALKIYNIKIFNLSSSVIIIAILLSVVNSYISVEFRIKLSYKKILLSKLFLTIGYIIGFLIFTNTLEWQYIIVSGYAFEFIYCLCSTSIWKEPLKITSNFKKTIKRVLYLLVSSFIGSTLIYFDRLLIYPIFGGSELSFYYAASIVGKTVSLISSPVTSVVLSYISRTVKITKKQYIIYSSIIVSLSVVGFIFCICISRPIILILYPDLLSGSLKYIPYVVFGSMLSLIYSFLWPIVLKFGNESYPVIIIIIKTIIYIGTVMILIKLIGIFGIIYANLLASLIQLILIFILGFKITKNNN